MDLAGELVVRRLTRNDASKRQLLDLFMPELNRVGAAIVDLDMVEQRLATIVP